MDGSDNYSFYDSFDGLNDATYSHEDSKNVQEYNFAHLFSADSCRPVAGHVSIAYRGCIVTWGGHYDGTVETHYRDPYSLYICPFRLNTKGSIWVRYKCKGTVDITPTTGATAALYKYFLYIFGGCVNPPYVKGHLTCATLLVFNLIEGKYSLKYNSKDGCYPTPRDKSTSWVANNKFFVFGGYGKEWHRLNDSSRYFYRSQNFHHHNRGQCWNNQLFYFDILDENWALVEQGGDVPSPRAASCSAYVELLNKVFLFGGRHDSNRLDDLYELDLSNYIWRKIVTPESELVGRSWSTLTFIPDQQKIILFGGLSNTSEPLNEFWELDISDYFSKAFKQQNGTVHPLEFGYNSDGFHENLIPVPKWSSFRYKFPARLWHTATLIQAQQTSDFSPPSSKFNGKFSTSYALVIYGGLRKDPKDENPCVGTLLYRQFQPTSLLSIGLQALTKHLAEFHEDYGESIDAARPFITAQLYDSMYILTMLQTYRLIESLDEKSPHYKEMLKYVEDLTVEEVKRSKLIALNGDLSGFFDDKKAPLNSFFNAVDV